MAIVAKSANKPFHVVAESYKFVRLYPLNQQDVPNKWKVRVIDCMQYLVNPVTLNRHHSNKI